MTHKFNETVKGRTPEVYEPESESAPSRSVSEPRTMKEAEYLVERAPKKGTKLNKNNYY